MRKNMIKNKKELLVISGMLSPCVFLLAVFIMYPLLWVLRYMFFEYNGPRRPRFNGIDNFIRIFTNDADYWHSVVNTFICAAGSLLIIMPLAFALALLLNSTLKGKSIFRAMVFMPTIISTAVVSMVFYFMFNPYNGIINQILTNYGFIAKPINWFGKELAMLTVILVAVWSATGNYMIYFLAGLQTIPDEIFESAKLDGANYPQQLFYLIIPMMGPILQTVLMLAIIASLKGFESIMVLTGGGPAGVTEVMYLYVYKLFFPMQGESSFAQQYGYGSAVAFVTALITGVITLMYLRVSKKMND